MNKPTVCFSQLNVLRRRRDEELRLQAAITARKQAEEAEHLLELEEKNRRRHRAMKEKASTKLTISLMPTGFCAVSFCTICLSSHA